MATGISSPLALGGLFPSVDGGYVAANGKPFTSVSNAESALNGFPSKLSESCVGLTVLVKESGWTEAKEYWVQPKGTTPETYGLVEKGAGTTDYNNLDNKPTIGDGTNTALPIVGNVKVSTSTASGSTAGVTVTPGQNTGEIEMTFTLPKGADGADGQDGQDGAPGHNPNLGTYLDTDTNKPTSGQAGDYFIVIDTTVTPRTASVWAWNGSAFADTEKSVEDFMVQFASGQPVANVHIKDEKGEDDPDAQGVLSAEAGDKMSKIVNKYAQSILDAYAAVDVTIEFDGNSGTVVTTAGYLFLGDQVAKRINATNASFTPNGLLHLVYSVSNKVLYVKGYNVALTNSEDYVIGLIDCTNASAIVNCRKLVVNGVEIRQYRYNEDSAIKYVGADIDVDFVNRTLVYSSGRVFNGRKSYATVLNAGSISWTSAQDSLSYIVFSPSQHSLYRILYNEDIANVADLVVGVLAMTGKRIVIDCKRLTIDGNVVADFTEEEKELLQTISAVTPMPSETTFPTSTWDSDNSFDTRAGTTGIFFDTRNMIGQNARLSKIHVRAYGTGTTTIHIIDASDYSTAYSETFPFVDGVNEFSFASAIDYTKSYYVGFQNNESSAGVMIDYYEHPTNPYGRKKDIVSGTVESSTVPMALWIDVMSMETTLPYRVSALEAAQGITTWAQLNNAVSLGYAKIELGECDITLNGTLNLASGTKLVGVRGKSILRVPSSVLKGIELSGVEDVTIEGITLIGAYNGTPIKTGMQPVRPGIIDTAADVTTLAHIGYQTDMDNGGVTETYVPQIGINIKSSEKVEIIGCEIQKFSYYGIANALSGKNYRYACKFENNYINNCYCGIYLYKEAERSQYIANNVSLCQIGLFLDSGTNMFTDCAFNANRIGMWMGHGYNHAHGVQTGNAYTHNSLFSIYVNEVGQGETFTQCKFGYVDNESGNSHQAIYVKNSRGLFFINCQFIDCRTTFDGVFNMAYTKTSTTSADIFGNTDYVMTGSSVTGEDGMSLILGASFLSGGTNPITKSNGFTNTNLSLKNNYWITGADSSALNN